MAKKKEQIEDGDTIVIEDQRVPKKAGRDLMDFITSGQALVNRPRQVIPVSPAVDLMLGGGIPKGSFFIPTGPPKFGKTVTALQFCANAQQEQYGGCEVYYYNIEGRLKSRDLKGIHGLILDKFHVIESHSGDILDGEEYMDIGEKLINEKPGSIHVFDSFSQLCTSARREGEIGARFRDDTPLLLANFCKRISNVLPVNNSIVIGITHLIANQGGGPMAPKWSEASGQKVQYAVDVKLRGAFKQPWEVAGVQIGQELNWKCECSAIGPPGKCMSLLRYGYGLDKEAELITIASDFGLIKKGGAWYTFATGEKAQGLENARNLLVANPKLYNEIYDQVKEMVGWPKEV